MRKVISRLCRKLYVGTDNMLAPRLQREAYCWRPACSGRHIAGAPLAAGGILLALIQAAAK